MVLKNTTINTTQNDDEQADKPLTMCQKIKQDKKSIFIMMSLYFVQGVIQRYPTKALQYDLTSHGADTNQLGLLTLSRYSYTIKFLFAPIQDNHYLTTYNLGRRKTFIVICGYITCVLYFIFTFFINFLVDNLYVLTITALFTFINALVNFQSVSVDAWPVTLFSPDNIAFASSCLLVGTTLGGLYSISIYLYLSSPSFCEQYFNSGPIMSPQSLFFTTFIICVAITVYIHFGVDEVTVQPKQKQTIHRTFLMIKKMFTFEKYKTMLLFYSLYDIGFQAIEQVGSVYIIENGYPQSMMSTLTTAMIPIYISCVYFASYITQIKQGFQLYYLATFLRLVSDIYYYFIIMETFKPNYDLNLVNLNLYFYTAINTCVLSIVFVTRFSFFQKICVKGIEATFINLWSCIGNMGSIWGQTVAFYLVDFFGFTWVVFGGFTFASCLHVYYYSILLGYEKQEKADWHFELEDDEVPLQNQNQVNEEIGDDIQVRKEFQTLSENFQKQSPHQSEKLKESLSIVPLIEHPSKQQSLKIRQSDSNIQGLEKEISINGSSLKKP